MRHCNELAQVVVVSIHQAANGISNQVDRPGSAAHPPDTARIDYLLNQQSVIRLCELLAAGCTAFARLRLLTGMMKTDAGI